MPDPTLLDRKLVYQGRTLGLAVDRVVLPHGVTTEHLTLIHPGAVVVIPQTASGSLLLVRQYRHSVGARILEFPAGTVNRGEEPATTAARELPEEIGFEARTWRSLGTLFPAPGFCDEVQYCYLASDLVPKRMEADEDECIEVEELDVRAVEEAITDGTLSDGKSLAIFLRARLAGLL